MAVCVCVVVQEVDTNSDERISWDEFSKAYTNKGVEHFEVRYMIFNFIAHCGTAWHTVAREAKRARTKELSTLRYAMQARAKRSSCTGH